MRNRRQRLTPLAVIVELHVVFLSFECIYVCVTCTCLCVYVCVRVYPLFLAHSSSPFHSYSLAFLLFLSLSLSLYLSSFSFTLSFHLSAHATHGVTCDRFMIRRRMRFTLIPAGSFNVKLVGEKTSPRGAKNSAYLHDDICRQLRETR